MRKIFNDPATKRTILLLFAVSILQPYIVLIDEYGPSNACWNCLIIEQTYLVSLLFLVLPLVTLYVLLKWLRVHWIILGFVLVAYYVPVSFVKITVPLFDDRIASWSTFSDQEVWDTALFMSKTYFGILAFVFFVLFALANWKYRKKNPSDLLDEVES